MTLMKELQVQDNILLQINFLKYAIVTVSLPAISLLWCFVTGIIFQFDQVNETVCKAQNVVPSISAVTGITPGAYVWRICIAIHCTPRFAVGFLHYNHYKKRAESISEKYKGLYLKLISLNFWIYQIENSCLVAVTYISNKENYPVHEKIFVVFMISCCCYMLLNTIIFRWSRSSPMTERELFSYKIKKYMWLLIMVSTAGLIYSFILHRFYCVPFAFSFFSACEYFIAYSNMAYHVSAYLEFSDLSVVYGHLHTVPVPNNTNGTSIGNGEAMSPRRLRSRKKGEKVH
ncbi:post-GPI attachment to proteins factor 2-like [Mytilus edulis]|uniref:post-GPI attachment to proteins factor 2-like n=1 Tax=Mytilus edulis TaxID=6550 RepID=UPI0039EE3721